MKSYSRKYLRSSWKLNGRWLKDRLANLSDSRKDLLCILVLLLLSTIFFANVLFSRKVLVSDNLMRYRPWSQYATEELSQASTNRLFDKVLANYPQMLTASRIVRAGNPPLWNPYYLSGTPFLATEPWGAFFYPINVVFYLLDPLKAFGYVSFIHLFLAGIFMYFYLRSIGLDRTSSLFGAVAFEFGGFLLANLTWAYRVGTAVWMPLIFLCFEKWVRGERLFDSILLTFAIAMSFLAGMVGEFAYIILSLGLYGTFRSALIWRDGGVKRAVKAMGGLLVAVVVGTVALSAVQLLPVLEALPFSERVASPYESRFEGGNSPLSLATGLVPDIFGNPVDESRPEWSTHQFGASVPGNYAEPNIYSGLFPLIGAAWALAFRRDRYALFFAGLGLLSISIVVDFPSLIGRLLYYLPVFRTGRPVEAKVMYMFAIPVLASLGFNSLAEAAAPHLLRRVKKAAMILGGIGCAVILGVTAGVMALSLAGSGAKSGAVGAWWTYNVPNFLRFSLMMFFCSVPMLLRAQGRLHLFYLSATVILMLDMFHFGWRFNPPQNPESLYFETEGIRFLQGDKDMFRIIRGPRGKNSLPSNTPEVYGISDAQGYTSFRLSYYGQFMDLIEEGISEGWHIHPLREPGSLSSKLLDLLNVKYILTGPMADGGLSALDEADDNIEIVYDGDMRIFENKDVLPRAFVATEYRVLQDKGEIFAELTADDFDPASYVILEEEPEPQCLTAGTSTVESSASIVEYTPNRVTIEVEMSRDGFLVLSDLYYSGWKASVDGEQEKIYKADYIFRAVQLGEGKHVVEFVFDPLSFKIGLSSSVLTLLLMGSLLAYTVLSKM